MNHWRQFPSYFPNWVSQRDPSGGTIHMGIERQFTILYTLSGFLNRVPCLGAKDGGTHREHFVGQAAKPGVC